ncbi:MAG: tRNA preQ1(34) S-adenosylmethionine ribosyltransferase-isomerase QueA [Gammaproteobacteria bacterium]|nr:tRNA preQ1(34) S-adenosylmethionine ribosyltransferase-isomerase QueA [Gammaproteobacteria bacterium]
MKRSDFYFDLPHELIAQYPLERRDDSRLLYISRETGELRDRQFRQLLDFLAPGDLLIFNNSKVIPARLFGYKDSGGKVEILIERIIDDKTVLAQVRASKTPGAGTRIYLDYNNIFIVSARDNEFFQLRIEEGDEIFSILKKFGHIPLPPYIRREDSIEDKDRYQTVYAKIPGAVAAPTAGLHFSKQVFQHLKEKKISTGYVTLHVGAGTFQPVRCNEIKDHKMHREWFSINEELSLQVERTRQQGGRVIAVGTTVVRALESAASGGKLAPGTGDTDIFIYPGYKFQLIDGLITNFHLPESTLLMLISAFAGKELIIKAYDHAISEKYRFFSYGDAMLIL